MNGDKRVKSGVMVKIGERMRREGKVAGGSAVEYLCGLIVGWRYDGVKKGFSKVGLGSGRVRQTVGWARGWG